MCALPNTQMLNNVREWVNCIAVLKDFFFGNNAGRFFALIC